MPKQRGHGEGGLFWDERRQRFIAEVTVGWTPAGKRIVRRGSGKTKTEARAKLKAVLRDREEGAGLVKRRGFTVADAVQDFLKFGLAGRSESTVANYTTLAENHIIRPLGARQLPDLTADEGDQWLAGRAPLVSTRTLRLLRSIAVRSVDRAMKRDKVKRNVLRLCEVPDGLDGRPSKSLTLEQAHAVLDAAHNSRLCAYIVVSLLTGARTEELRALEWKHVDLHGRPDAQPPVPPTIEVWHSVREGADTKTRKSRRTLALPTRCVAALQRHRAEQDRDRTNAGKRWTGTDLVFASKTGTELDAANVRRALRRVMKLAGLDSTAWTPRELRHSFVSLLSDDGVSLEAIADLCGHSGTTVTETVYRHQLRPVLLTGAVAMDRIFASAEAPTDG